MQINLSHRTTFSEVRRKHVSVSHFLYLLQHWSGTLNQCFNLQPFKCRDPKSFIGLLILLILAVLLWNTVCLCVCTNFLRDNIPCCSFHRKTLFKIYTQAHSTPNNFGIEKRWGKRSQPVVNERCQTGWHSLGCLQAQQLDSCSRMWCSPTLENPMG